MDDPPAYFRANWELHRLLALLSGNAPLRSIYLTLIGYLEQALEGAVFDAFDGPASAAVHRELVEAIAAGPGPRLEAAIAAHAPLGTLEVSGDERAHADPGRPRPGGLAGGGEWTTLSDPVARSRAWLVSSR